MKRVIGGLMVLIPVVVFLTVFASHVTPMAPTFVLLAPVALLVWFAIAIWLMKE